jgi:glycosyltransferase involved in cell wall biosynthesis
MSYSRLLKKDIYLHFHGELFIVNFQNSSLKRKKIVFKHLSKAKKIIIIGETYIQKYSHAFPTLVDKLVICKNGIRDEFEPSLDSVKFKMNNPISTLNILYLSNLIESKGILDLLESIPYLISKNLQFKLHICGAIEPGIRTKVKELFCKYEKYIIYHGIVDGEIKKEILKGSNIFCLPTYMPSEAQPISILEAMANANVIVTTDQGGILDIFKDGVNGYLCEKKNPNVIAEAIFIGYINSNNIANFNFNEFKSHYSEKAFIDRFFNVLISD